MGSKLLLMLANLALAGGIIGGWLAFASEIRRRVWVSNEDERAAVALDEVEAFEARLESAQRRIATLREGAMHHGSGEREPRETAMAYQND